MKKFYKEIVADYLSEKDEDLYDRYSHLLDEIDEKKDEIRDSIEEYDIGSTRTLKQCEGTLEMIVEKLQEVIDKIDRAYN